MTNPSPTTQFGRYEIVRPLGEGGMAQVYCAHDPMLDRQVAVKVVGHELLGDAGFAERFRREARAIAALRHAHIVQVYDFGEQDGAYYMVMEYVEGQNLAERMAALRASGQRMPLSEALDIIDEMAGALDYAHAHGVVHRDVKPANVLLRGDNPRDAVLADFGLVLMLDRATEVTQGGTFGTPDYIAPEQALHSSDATARSDIYSLGVVAYALLTGELPFVGDTPLNLALQHVNDPPRSMRQFVPDLPPAVESAVLRALEKEPARRYATAGELAASLRRAVADPAGAAPAEAPAHADTPTAPYAQPAMIWPAAAAVPGEPVTRIAPAEPAVPAPLPQPAGSQPADRTPAAPSAAQGARASGRRRALGAWNWVLAALLLGLCAVFALVAGLLLNSGILERLSSVSFMPPAATPAGPTAQPTVARQGGAPISDARLTGQTIVKVDGKKKFVSALTFAIAAGTYDGLWAELDGKQIQPSACRDGACTFEVTLQCDSPASQRITFHSGVYWRYTTFTVEKPPACKG